MSFLCAEWFTTAYARNTSLPLALYALDLFTVELDDVMVRLGLAILEVFNFDGRRSVLESKPDFSCSVQFSVLHAS